MKKSEELFNRWNNEKIFIDKFWKIKRVKNGELWVAKIWVNIWSEISKNWDFVRPVLVLRNHMWGDLISIIPITTKYNDNYSKFLLEIKNYGKYWLSKKSYLSLNNFKTISCKRLVYKINDKKINWRYKYLVKENYLKIIKNKLKEIYDL